MDETLEKSYRMQLIEANMVESVVSLLYTGQGGASQYARVPERVP